MRTTESQYTTETKLRRIAWLSARDKGKQFDSLLHHMNESSLKECFYQLSANRAVGVDGIGKADYAANLDGNLKELVDRMESQVIETNGPALADNDTVRSLA